MIKNPLIPPAISAMVMAFMPVKLTTAEIAFIALSFIMLGLNALCREVKNFSDELKKNKL